MGLLRQGMFLLLNESFTENFVWRTHPRIQRDQFLLPFFLWQLDRSFGSLQRSWWIRLGLVDVGGMNILTFNCSEDELTLKIGAATWDVEI